LSFSADVFVIKNKKLPTPSLMGPTDGDVFYSYITFYFDHNAIVGRCSKRSFYEIHYKSNDLNIDWTLFQGNIMVGSDPTSVDVSHFKTGSDYSFKIELIDGDNSSNPVFINNININNLAMFLIDTLPPKGAVSVIGNSEYTKEKSFILDLSASDETSAVKDVKIIQKDIGTNISHSDDYVPFSSLVTFDVKGVSDGVKLIQAKYRDYGDNVIDDSTFSNYFRTYKKLENRKVSVIMNDNITESKGIYYAFVGEGINHPQLYRDLTLVSTLIGDATSLKIYNNSLYIAIKDDENKGVLQVLYGSELSTVYDNENEFTDPSSPVNLNSLYLVDSVINSMEVFDNALFLGLENGTLLSFRGASVVNENDEYLNRRKIINLKTDGNLLYIMFSNTTEMLAMHKDSDGNYFFKTIDTEN
jgi:hypothetical protein